MTSIYAYTNYRIFIKERCEELKKSTPCFSYRYIAQKCDLKSSGFISWVVSGKRTISVELAIRIASALKLNKREAQFFELLVLHNQAKTEDQRKLYHDRMLSYRSTYAKVMKRDRQRYYSKWYYSAIRELVAVTEIKDEQQVASLLNPPVKVSEAKEALELLLRLGLIGMSEEGIYIRMDAAITSGPDIEPAIIHSFQSATMQLAQSALNRIPKEERDISTITISCDSRDIERIRERIRQLRADISEIACGSDADQVFQFNTQFYPLSKRVPGSSS